MDGTDEARLPVCLTALLLAAAGATTPALGGEAAAFPTASIHFEQNATDGDHEVVFQIKGAKDGLAELTIVAPNGRRVAVFSAPERATLGMRQFRFESPEPQDSAALKSAYPEGDYVFSGKTFSGASLAGKSTLSHRLPPTTEIVADAARVRWRAVAGVSGYVVEVKTQASSIAARLPATATSLALPAGFLSRGTAFKVSLGTVGPEGNISFVESSFTAGQ